MKPLTQNELLQLVTSPGTALKLSRVLLLLGSFGVIALFVPWQQTAVGVGRVVAYQPLDRQQVIKAPTPGRVVRWFVTEGTHVEAGDQLVELSDNDPEILSRLDRERSAVVSRLEAAKARSETVRMRITSLEASRSSAIDAARSRIAISEQQVNAAEQLVHAAEAGFNTAKLNLDRQKELVEGGLTSQRQYELAQLEHTRALTELQRARNAYLGSQNDVDARTSEQVKAGTDGQASINEARGSLETAIAEEANAAGELARLDIRITRQSLLMVTAPRSGTVLRLIAVQGVDQLKEGDPLAVLVPDTTERAVELWIDGNDVPLIQEGKHVRLQFEGWPAVQFTGWPSVAVGTFGGTIKLIDSADNGRGEFRVLVMPDAQAQVSEDPWPSPRYLRQGVRANGWVFLGRVTLGFELWRQLNGFPPSVPVEPENEAQKK